MNFGLANHLVLQMVEFIGLESLGEGVFSEMVNGWVSYLAHHAVLSLVARVDFGSPRSLFL